MLVNIYIMPRKGVILAYGIETFAGFYDEGTSEKCRTILYSNCTEALHQTGTLPTPQIAHEEKS